MEQCLIGHCAEKQSTVGIMSEPADAISSEHMCMTYVPEGSMPVHDGYALPDDNTAQQWRKAHNTGQRGASKQRESRSIIHLQASSHVADTRAVAVRTCKDNDLSKTSNQALSLLDARPLTLTLSLRRDRIAPRIGKQRQCAERALWPRARSA